MSELGLVGDGDIVANPEELPDCDRPGKREGEQIVCTRAADLGIDVDPAVNTDGKFSNPYVVKLTSESVCSAVTAVRYQLVCNAADDVLHFKEGSVPEGLYTLINSFDGLMEVL